MSERIKNYLGAAIIVSILVLAFSAWQYVKYYSQSIQPGSFRSFSVSGEGKVFAIPDVAEFSFSVLTEGGKDIALLQKENSEKSNRIIEFLKSNGVASKDIKTVSYNLTPRYQTCFPSRNGSCPPAEIVGYSINQSVQVKVRDFSKIGNILSGVVEHGANVVSELQFTIDDPAEFQNKAREEAIKRAKDKAYAIAQAGGFSLGRLLFIEESSYEPPVVFYAKSGLASGPSAPAPTIEPGAKEVTVKVTLRYEIR
jgi:uncharacterized protein YggE